jgi:alcohol dehydrogenase class IV
MTGSNLTPYDYIIVQRGDKNYRISGDQILNFSMEQIQPQLDEIEMALELEKQLRERGDKQSIDALEDFLQRLEENINQVFPVQDSVFYKYKIDYPNNAELASEYYGCSGQPISVYPRVDDQPTSPSCSNF